MGGALPYFESRPGLKGENHGQTREEKENAYDQSVVCNGTNKGFYALDRESRPSIRRQIYHALLS